MNKTLSLASLFLLCIGCQHGSALRDSVQNVAISDLVSNPEFYNNAIVRIEGPAVMRFEAQFICARIADIGSGEKCLWLSPVVRNGTLGQLDSHLYHKNIVVIVGVFDKDNLGHMGAYGGTVAPISTRIVGSHDQDGGPPPPEPSSPP